MGEPEGSATGEKRKPGRPAGSGAKKPTAATQTRTPGAVAKVDKTKHLKMGLQFAYGLPATVGLGDHWALDDDDAQDLAGELRTVLDAFPNATQERIWLLLEKYAPVISLILVWWAITMPKLIQTRQHLAEKAEERRQAKLGQQNERAAA
jgi:hypothetical protein